MARKINVRSPFYLFMDDTNLTTEGGTTTTAATTTAATTTAATTTAATTTASGGGGNGTTTTASGGGGTTTAATTTAATTTAATTTAATTTAATDPYNYYFVRGCTGTNYSNQDMVIRTLNAQTNNGGETTGAAVYSIFGSCWYIYNNATATDYSTNAGDLNSQTVGNADFNSCSACASPTTTAATTTAQQYTEFYISAGRNALGDFCGTGSPVQNIVSVPGTNKTYANSLNSYVYTINNGNATAFNGSNKWFIVYNSPMNFQGSYSFNYWEITPQGQIVSTGVHQGCTSSTNSGGGNIGNEY